MITRDLTANSICSHVEITLGDQSNLVAIILTVWIREHAELLLTQGIEMV
jgi:hypothetical protein